MLRPLHQELQIAQQLALAAGAVIMAVYDTEFEVQTKFDQTPVTEADQQANDLIVKGLAETFPQDAILAEESDDDLSRLDNDYCWIIDPLDGTKEFVQRNDEFTVNIALAYQHQIVLGVIFLPVKNEMYFAVRRQGAFKVKNDVSSPIKVAPRLPVNRLAMSRSHLGKVEAELIERLKPKTVIQAGSSLKGCLIASGEADFYVRLGPTREWDIAAMQVIVDEAGGLMAQASNEPLTYNRPNTLNENGFFVAASAQVWEQVRSLQIIH